MRKVRHLLVLAALLMSLLVAELSRGQQAARRPNNMFPQWSHDGRKIAFTSDRDGDPEIYVMNADGSGAVRLTHTPGRDAHPSFVKDGGGVLFQSPRDGGDTNIFVMNADGSNQVQLTRLKGFAGVPVYSPDQTRIAFQWRASNDFEDQLKWVICVMDSDGSLLRVITPGQANDQVPNWSPGGDRLLFYSDRSGRNQLYTMKSDGSDVQLVAASPANDLAAFWSPGGEHISFSSDRDGNLEVYVMDADGRNPKRLTHTPEAEFAPVWSPDGERIAFVRQHEGNAEIYLIRPDGSDLRQLTGQPR
jgi:Tol biopolymer transport system component